MKLPAHGCHDCYRANGPHGECECKPASAKRTRYKPTVADRMSRAFQRLLRRDLGPTTYAEIIRRNRAEAHPGVCHSHDFCDANEIMFDAFKIATGREPNVSDDMDQVLWSDAWDLFRARTDRRGGAR